MTTAAAHFFRRMSAFSKIGLVNLHCQSSPMRVSGWLALGRFPGSSLSRPACSGLGRSPGGLSPQKSKIHKSPIGERPKGIIPRTIQAGASTAGEGCSLSPLDILKIYPFVYFLSRFICAILQSVTPRYNFFLHRSVTFSPQLRQTL